MTRQSRLRKLAMGLLVAAVLLAALELGLRIAWPGGRYMHWTPNVHAGLPVTTNSSGFRGPEIHPRQPGEFRVLCLGDSNTLGMGEAVEDTWPQQLERVMRETLPGARVVTMNAAGLGGFPHKSLESWPRYEPLDPDLVLYLMSMNDVVLRPPAPAPAAGTATAGAPAPPQPDDDRIWRRPRVRLAVFTSRLGWLRIVGAAKYLARSLFPLDLPQILDLLPDEFYTLGYGPPELVERAWAETADSLHGLAEQARSRDARFALMLLPYRYTISSLPADDHFRLRETMVADPAARLEALAREAGFPFVDLTPVFRAARTRMQAREQPYDPLYQPFDYVHPDAAGYRLVAEAAAPLVKAAMERGAHADGGP